MNTLKIVDNYQHNENVDFETVIYDKVNDKVYVKKPSLYTFVDLGLPSGIKWATTNVGATKPEESGLYFQWGDTKGYTAEEIANGDKTFNWDNYKFSVDGSATNITKYNLTDMKSVLDLEDDAAYQSDNTCRIPTENEINELINNTVNEVAIINEISGKKFIGSNGNFIFIPFAGTYENKTNNLYSIAGHIWASTTSIDSIIENNRYGGQFLFINNDITLISNNFRFGGRSIRPVQEI